MIDFCKTCLYNPCKCAKLAGDESSGAVDASMLCAEVSPAQRVVRPRDAVDIGPEDEEVFVVGTRDAKVTLIDGLPASLQTLVLRSCLLTTTRGVEGLVNLVKLELYDNQISSLPDLSSLANLRVLDLSYNELSEVSALRDCCARLEELYLAQNKLKALGDTRGGWLAHLAHLRVLDLGANRLRELGALAAQTDQTGQTGQVDQVGGLRSLRSLWLGKNKITSARGLAGLTALTQLDLQSNRIEQLDQELAQMHQLQELYLSHNGIRSVSGALPNPSALHTVDLSSNPLESVAGLCALEFLRELWLGSTQLQSESLEELAALTKLECLYLEHSPVAASADYRARVKQALPWLKQIDADDC